MAAMMVVDVICDRCQKAMYIPKDFEPTGLCHDCAYETVDDLRAFIRELFEVSEWPDGGDIDLGDFQGPTDIDNIRGERFHAGAGRFAAGMVSLRTHLWYIPAKSYGGASCSIWA